MKEKIDLKKEFLSNQIILLSICSNDYSKMNKEILKQLNGKSICYVTLNKTFESLKEFLKNKKINIENIIFIDAVSKIIKESPDQAAHCYFLDSPNSLDDLSVKINKFLRHKFDYLIFDSFNNLSTYKKELPVSKFILKLKEDIKKSKTKALFYILDSKKNKEVIKQAFKFADKVIEYK